MSPRKKKTRPVSNSFVAGKRPLLASLRGQLPTLNPTERLIAECVLADPERVISSPVAELSQACRASVGAIINFCQKLGMKGFAEFRIAVARDLAQAGLPAGQEQHQGSTFE